MARLRPPLRRCHHRLGPAGHHQWSEYLRSASGTTLLSPLSSRATCPPKRAVAIAALRLRWSAVAASAEALARRRLQRRRKRRICSRDPCHPERSEGSALVFTWSRSPSLARAVAIAALARRRPGIDKQPQPPTETEWASARSLAVEASAVEWGGAWSTREWVADSRRPPADSYGPYPSP